jgi:L-fuconolactonase
MVVDHMAKPPIARGEIDEWARALERVASIETVHCKLSGLVTEADLVGWRTEDLWPYVEHAIACFGPERLMFGSDYPVCLRAASYRRVLDAFEVLLAWLCEPDLTYVFAENATRFYKL